MAKLEWAVCRENYHPKVSLTSLVISTTGWQTCFMPVGPTIGKMMKMVTPEHYFSFLWHQPSKRTLRGRRVWAQEGGKGY